MAREDAGEQPGGGAGIAHVENVIRRGQAADAATGDEPGGAVPRDVRAQSPHGGGGAQHVLAFQQAGDAGLPNRQRAEHQSAMADGFVARYGDFTGKRGAGAGRGERPCRL